MEAGNRVAASLATPDTPSCLRELQRLAPRIGLAEVRLDLMRSFDISRLVTDSPVPLILTCRPEREHGRFAGTESERMAILRTAYESGCAYVDVEADCLDSVSGWDGSPTGIIASRHWFDRMPPDLAGQYAELRDRCAVVKLVGTARSAPDVIPVLELLADATTPVIGIAMGGPGTCTRLMAPAFPHALLTYGSAGTAAGTAPGQVTVDEMVDRYALHLVGADTKVYLHVISTERQYAEVLGAQDRAARGAELHVSLTVADADAAATAALVAAALPQASVVVTAPA